MPRERRYRCAVTRPARPLCFALLCLLLACDGGKDSKSSDAKAADAKAADAKAADVKAPDAAKPAADPTLAATTKQFDVTLDKSGALARTAAVIEASKAHDDENLRSLSHHAESLPGLEELCKHEIEVGKSDVALPSCIKAMEHLIVQIGPEIYAQYATCIMEAKNADEIAVCDAAEQEAERILHVRPHGDGLAADVCEQLFTQFEKLSVADAGDHAELVREVLEEVKADVVTTCQEQGTKAEVDCAMAATSMAELNTCASKLL
jgi:hypothetical protein